MENNSRPFRTAFAICAVFFISACSDGGSPPPAPSPPPPPPAATPTPMNLSADELTGAATPDLHDMAAFEASPAALSSAIPIAGTLRLPETSIVSDLSFNLEAVIHSGYSPARFPAVDLRLVSDGADLIPLDRGLLAAWPFGGSYWDVIVGPGRVWREQEDGGWSRAALPLTLASRKEGQARNCVATFLYDATKTSNVFVQCSQENAAPSAFTPGDMRVHIAAEFEPATSFDFDDEISAFRAEREDRYPVRDWSELPALDPTSVLSDFNEGASAPGVRSFSGLIVDGVLYREAPPTRHGPYPFPDDMRHGVHSITKSLAAGLSMLYFAERYGDDIFDTLITDLIPEAVGLPGWQGVTLEHVLNMATGTAGEDAGAVSFVFRPDGAFETLEFIADIGDAPPFPGMEFSYATTHTFVLSFALQRLVESREGPDAQYWDLVQKDVLDPIGVFNLPMQFSLEMSGESGVPTLGVGAFPTADDVAKIVQLYLDEGVHDGVRLLSARRTREALNRTTWPGYQVSQYTNYQHSFWLFTATSSVYGCSYRPSMMQGFGGNHVVFTPGGVVGIRLKDDDDYSIAPILRAAEKIRPSC